MLTKEILSSMSLKSLRLLDVKSPEEEALIQEAVSEKTAVLPTVNSFNRIHVPDIKNPEMEAEWQEKIDEHDKTNRPIEEQVAIAEKELEAVEEELEEVPPVVDTGEELSPSESDPSEEVIEEPKKRGRPKKV